MIRTRFIHRAVAAGIATVALAAGLGLPAATATPLAVPSAAPAALPKLPTAPVVRIGFFANVTHAPALVAAQLRLFEAFLGKDGTAVEYTVFNAGPAEIEAMKGGAIDVGYIGPNPSISGYTSTGGTLLRVVSGATSGGAQLVVKPGINSVADLKGKKIATPQLGNTQDVALRSWLKDNGLTFNSSGGGDVTIVPTENATTLALFKRGGPRRRMAAGALVLPTGDRGRRQGPRRREDALARRPVRHDQHHSRHRHSSRSTRARSGRSCRRTTAPSSTSPRNITTSKDLVQQQIKRWTGAQLADPRSSTGRGATFASPGIRCP